MRKNTQENTGEIRIEVLFYFISFTSYQAIKSKQFFKQFNMINLWVESTCSWLKHRWQELIV